MYAVEEIVLRNETDALAWSARYHDSLAYLRDEFDIHADHAPASWMALFRAPGSLRNGRPEVHERLGDPCNVGTWTYRSEA